MLYKVTFHKRSNGQKGYAVMIDFFSDTRNKNIATYTTYVNTKKEATQWEIKNKEWLNNTAKGLTGI